MRENEVVILSTENKNPSEIANYVCYKTKRNGEVVQVERYDVKAWDGTFWSRIVVHGSGKHGQLGGIWSKTLNTYRCTSFEEANKKGSRKLEKFLNNL